MRNIPRANVTKVDHFIPVMGGRNGMVFASLADFMVAFGLPAVAYPPGGKVTMEWCFKTPRGPATVRDYWWNAERELSIGAANYRAALWVAAFLRAHGLRATART